MPNLCKANRIRFPFPIGELHFSIYHKYRFHNFEILVSVPYRGATFLNRSNNINILHTSVSVPYRGATFLNIFAGILIIFIYGPFPSPIGELHFSIASAKRWVSSNLFPSPIGELHFSMVSAPTYNNMRQFPSPIGELHFSINPNLH